jgi:hypothetical protein
MKGRLEELHAHTNLATIKLAKDYGWVAQRRRLIQIEELI